MKDLINKVQQQLDNNHAVEANDIRQLIDFAERSVGVLLETNKLLSKMNYNPEAKNIIRLNHGIKFVMEKHNIDANT